MATALPAREVAMHPEQGDRMFASLPAVYRSRDTTGDLARLLGVFENFFFTGSSLDGAVLPGLEQQIESIPTLFLPIESESGAGQTPEPFLHWFASWLSFTPHALFSPEALRRIITGIVPLYGRRGTREYLEELLKLCFGAELAQVQIDDRPRVGFTVGESKLGVDTRLADSRPFWFNVTVECFDPPASSASGGRGALEHRLRAVIDFAKPAHTAYELQWRTLAGSGREVADPKGKG